MVLIDFHFLRKIRRNGGKVREECSISFVQQKEMFLFHGKALNNQ